MSDPFPSPPGTNPPRHVPNRDYGMMGWAAAGIAAVVVIGLTLLWAESGRKSTQANPPAVTAAPAPTTGTSPPAPETTTGRAPAPAR